MNLSDQRIQSVYQTWDFLVGLARDTNLPNDVRRDASWLLKHYPYSQKIHLSFPVPPDMRGDESLPSEAGDDELLDSMPPVWMTLGRRHW